MVEAHFYTRVVGRVPQESGKPPQCVRMIVNAMVFNLIDHGIVGIRPGLPCDHLWDRSEEWEVVAVLNLLDDRLQQGKRDADIRTCFTDLLEMVKEETPISDPMVLEIQQDTAMFLVGIDEKRKIQAIKDWRRLTNDGLRDSKNIIDQAMLGHPHFYGLMSRERALRVSADTPFLRWELRDPERMDNLVDKTGGAC